MRKYYWTRDYTKHKFLLPVLLLLFFTGGAWAQCSLADYTVNVDKDESSCKQSSVDIELDKSYYDDNFYDCRWKASIIDKDTDKSVRQSNIDEDGNVGTMDRLAQGTYYLKFVDDGGQGDQTYYWDGGTGFTTNPGSRGEITIHDDYIIPIVKATDNVSPSCTGVDENAEITLKITNKDATDGNFIFEIDGEGIEPQSSGEVSETEYTFTGINSGQKINYAITDLSCEKAVTKYGSHTLPGSPKTPEPSQIRYYFKWDCATQSYITQIGIYHKSDILEGQTPGTLELEIDQASGGTKTVELDAENLTAKKLHPFEYRFKLPDNLKPGDKINTDYFDDCYGVLSRNNYTLQERNPDILESINGYQEIATSGCSIDPMIFLNGTKAVDTKTYYDWVCSGTDIRVYQETPPDSDEYTELEQNYIEGADFIGGQEDLPWPENDFPSNREIRLKNDGGNPLEIPDGGNFEVELIDKEGNITKHKVHINKQITEKDTIQASIEDAKSFLEGTGGFAIPLNVKDDIGKRVTGSFRITIEPTHKNSITSPKCSRTQGDTWECEFDGPPGLEGQYTYDFPIEFTASPDKNNTIHTGDLPAGTYNITISNECDQDFHIEFPPFEIKELAHYACDRDTQNEDNSCIALTRNCSSVDVNYDLKPNKNTVIGTLLHAFVNGNKGTVPSMGNQAHTYGGMNGKFINAPSEGDFYIRMKNAGRGFRSAVNKENNFKAYGPNDRQIYVPVHVPELEDPDPNISYFCYITEEDEKRGQIEVNINSGSIVYPLHYEVLDQEGNVVGSYTAYEGDDTDYTIRGLEAHTVVDDKSDPIPEVYKVRVIPGYNEDTGRGCSLDSYDINNFDCPEIADIEITKKGNPERKFIDQKDDRDIEFIITVTNHGPERSTFNYVRDVLPEGYEPDEENPPVPSKGNYFTSGEDRGVWDIGILEIGETVELTLKGKILRGKADEDYLNRATFTSKSRWRRDSPYDRKAEAEIERLYHFFRVNPALMNRTPEPEN